MTKPEKAACRNPKEICAQNRKSGLTKHKWCKAYREGGAEALRPKPKGRPPGSDAKAVRKTRGQELEERVRKLEAENAYLKKLAALGAEKRLRAGRGPR